MLAGLGEMLQIKPVIAAYNSQVESVARVRTFKKIIPKLVELAEGQAPLERLAVLNLYSPDAVVELRAALQHVAPEGTITVMVTPAIGANLGPEGLGIATVRQK
jgi:fatty acid-binding protein DegV